MFYRSQSSVNVHRFLWPALLFSGAPSARAQIELTVPAGETTYLACNTATGSSFWAAPSATSPCGGVTLSCNGQYLPTGIPWEAERVMNGGTFPVGTSHFCCDAADGCANQVQQCWDVVVLNETLMEVKIELSPHVNTRPGDQLIRCIRFEVIDNCTEAPVVFDASLEFGGVFDFAGHYTGVVSIPAPVYPFCVKARDPQHTLRSCYRVKPTDCDAAGVLHVTFERDPFFDGNWLVGGNLDGWNSSLRTCNGGAHHGAPCASDLVCPGGTCDLTTLSSIHVIDILDVGAIIAEYLKTYDSDQDGSPDGNSPCGAFEGTHADINGDGLVDLLDYSFLTMNFLVETEECCCPGSTAANAVGRTEISVEDLYRFGLGHLAASDVNRDGMLDVGDLAAFLRGARPRPASRPPSK